MTKTGPTQAQIVREVHTEGMRAEWHRTVPMRRYEKPDEIAGAIEFLIYPAALSYVTRQFLAVDDSFTAEGLML